MLTEQAVDSECIVILASKQVTIENLNKEHLSNQFERENP